MIVYDASQPPTTRMEGEAEPKLRPITFEPPRRARHGGSRFADFLARFSG